MEANKERRTESKLEPIILPQPKLGHGGSLAEALRARRTVRAFSERALPEQILSDLLWAACGINRREGPFGVAGRAAASASNSQEVDVYVALRKGAYLYDAVALSQKLGLSDRERPLFAQTVGYAEETAP